MAVRCEPRPSEAVKNCQQGLTVVRSMTVAARKRFAFSLSSLKHRAFYRSIANAKRFRAATVMERTSCGNWPTIVHTFLERRFLGAHSKATGKAPSEHCFRHHRD